MKRLAKWWVLAALLAVLCACQGVPPEQTMEQALIAAEGILGAFGEEAWPADRWERIAPYHAAASAAVAEMRLSLESGGDAFAAAQAAFWAAMGEIMARR